MKITICYNYKPFQKHKILFAFWTASINNKQIKYNSSWSTLFRISISINNETPHSLIAQQRLLCTVVRRAKQSANYKHIVPLMTIMSECSWKRTWRQKSSKCNMIARAINDRQQLPQHINAPFRLRNITFIACCLCAKNINSHDMFSRTKCIVCQRYQSVGNANGEHQPSTTTVQAPSFPLKRLNTFLYIHIYIDMLDDNSLSR